MLTYNNHNGAFIWTAPADKCEPAIDAGFTLSLSAKGLNNEQIYFSTDRYAAAGLSEFGASDSCKKELDDLRDGLFRSRATTSEFDPPSSTGCIYLPYQRAGIEYATQRRHTLIGDAPGLGKTIQAIGFCNVVGSKRSLVVCPASLRINWQREIRKWSTIPNIKTYPIQKASDGVNPYSNYVIVSYDLARNEAIYRTLLQLNWDVVIFDEAHYLKSLVAKRTIALLGNSNTRGIVSKAGHILGLSGTPLPNRPREAYTITRALCWDAIDWMSYEKFCYRYNPSGVMPNGYVKEQSGRLIELQARMRCNFMVRRLKEEVLKDLPEKQYELSYVEGNTAINRVIRKERMLDFRIDDLIQPDAALFGQISTLRREMGEAMLPGMVRHICMVLDGGVEKVVVFAHHRSVLKGLYDELSDKWGRVVGITGSTSMAARQNAVDTFQRDPDVRIFLGQITAAGTGITLTAASHVILAEASWVPGENEQAVDRCHRIGQKSSVLAQFLVAEGSISEKILGRAIEKHHVTHKALDHRGV